MKCWWARVGVQRDNPYNYGRWIPTGCTTLAAAENYISTYPGERTVFEWLLF